MIVEVDQMVYSKISIVKIGDYWRLDFDGTSSLDRNMRKTNFLSIWADNTGPEGLYELQAFMEEAAMEVKKKADELRSFAKKNDEYIRRGTQ